MNIFSDFNTPGRTVGDLDSSSDVLHLQPHASDLTVLMADALTALVWI